MYPLVACLLSPGATTLASEIASGQPAPGFTLKSQSGRNLSLREYRGQVVMINFWATWCGPCRQEMPALNALYEKYRSAGFMLFGVNVDAESTSAAQMAGKLKVSYPILFDADKKASALYRVNTMPMTVLVDRDGMIRYVQPGYRDGYADKYQSQIREMLRQ
ncbi:MAG TPA: TlpA disulfide reductase family protein [Candidatus Methylomirabilis sp.]|nr:TlpA disulfide reductase family protein [Candidatus Methylomirabilis sp.]